MKTVILVFAHIAAFLLCIITTQGTSVYCGFNMSIDAKTPGDGPPECWLQCSDNHIFDSKNRPKTQCRSCAAKKMS